MGVLKPKFEKPGAKVYSSGYPNRSSAMFTSFRNWAMLPIYYNDESVPIRITSADIYFGVHNGSAVGKLYFAVLDNENQYKVEIQPVSDEFDIPEETDLSKCKTLYTNTAVIVPSKRWFIFGFKADDTSGNTWLSIARTNTDKNKCALFNGQFWKAGFGYYTVYRINTSDSWRSQTPRLDLNYEYVDYAPIITFDGRPVGAIGFSQGSSIVFNVDIPSYAKDGWGYRITNSDFGYDYKINGIDAEEYINNYGISITTHNTNKSGTLTVTSGKGDYSSPIEFAIRFQGYGGNCDVDIRCSVSPVMEPTLSVSLDYIRPGESSKISVPSGYHVDENYISHLSEYGLTFNNNTISVDYITEDVYTSLSDSDWRKHPNSEYTVYLKYTSDLNSCISNSISLTVKHFSYNDISVFAANYANKSKYNNCDTYEYKLFDTASLDINLIDSTNVLGGVKFKVDFSDDLADYSEYFTFDNKYDTIRYLGNCDVNDNHDLYISFISNIINDYCISKQCYIKLYLYDAIEVELISPYAYEDNKVKLPLVSIGNKISSNLVEFNPLSYPITFILPNTLKNIYTNEVGKLILNIARVDIYTNDETYYAYFDKNCTITSTSIEINSSNIGDFSNKFGSTSNLILGDTHIYVNSPELIAILDYKNLDDNTHSYSSYSQRYNSTTIRMYFEFSYYSNAISEPKTYPFAIDYIPVLGLVNKLSSENLQGEHFTIDSVKSDFTSILFAIDAIRHNYKYSDDRIIADLNENVGLLGNSSKYINKNSYISGKNNKEVIESALVDLNALIDVINKDRGYSKISKVRQNIAIGEYIMWDDSLDILADGSNNTFKNSENYLNSTASPYMELFNGLRTIQYGIETLVSYRNNEDNLIFYKNDSDEEFVIAVKF